MENIQKYGVAIAGIVLSVLFSVIAVSALKSGANLGEYRQVADYFYQGLYAGTTNQFSVDTNGNVTTSGTFTTTGSESKNGIVSVSGQVSGISTTTSTCVVNPPTATSSIVSFSYVVSSSSPNTTFLAFGTSTNPYATTSASSIATQNNAANGVRPLSYAAKANMFATTLDYLILYYTNGTTAGNVAEQQLGTCSVSFKVL